MDCRHFVAAVEYGLLWHAEMHEISAERVEVAEIPDLLVEGIREVGDGSHSKSRIRRLVIVFVFFEYDQRIVIFGVDLLQIIDQFDGVTSCPRVDEPNIERDMGHLLLFLVDKHYSVVEEVIPDETHDCCGELGPEESETFG